MVCTNFELCQWDVTRMADWPEASEMDSTESALAMVVGATSSVPGSMFHAS